MLNKINTLTLNTTSRSEKAEKNNLKNSAASPVEKSYNSIYDKNVAFNGLFTDVIYSNKFQDSTEKQMYKELQAMLSPKSKENLNTLLKTGSLLNKNSNDGSSVLFNLYKIATTERAPGLDRNKILDETLATLVNRFIINQNFGDLPGNLPNEILTETHQEWLKNGLGLDAAPPNVPRTVEDLNVTSSGTCVAASIEFNLADKRPAEFTRYVEGLTSPALCVKSNIKFSDIAPNFVDAVNLLTQFGVEFKAKNWSDLEVTLRPDRYAIVRARVQNTYKDPHERSLIDVLLQSTFMQLGSENTYNSLTDKRYGSFNPNDKGLTEFEKNFTEAIVDNDGGKTSVTYQIVDENARLVGYNLDYNTTLKHLTDTLNSGSNVIVGITEVDGTNKIIGGHEITIIGIRQGKDNELYFICNDTDDDYDGAVEIKAKDLIPKIHHAGIPNKVLNLSPQQEIGFELLREYQAMNSQNSAV